MLKPPLSWTTLLDRAVGFARQTDATEMRALLQVLIDQAMLGTVKFHGNLARTITRAIAAIDDRLSHQLAEIMHNARFLQLEGSWRGLHHLVMRSQTGPHLKIRVLNISKQEMLTDAREMAAVDRSLLFHKIYHDEFHIMGGEPYCCLVGDYQFSQHADDIAVLRRLSAVAAAAFAPLISAASPQMFGLEDFRRLMEVRDLESLFAGAGAAPWRSFRDSEDARFAVLTLPRALARLPYGVYPQIVEPFDYQECEPGKRLDHAQYCWMNAAYLVAARLTDAAATDNWCTAICGIDGGGRVRDLPVHAIADDRGDIDHKGPTEAPINDRREWELSRLGFLPLYHIKGSNDAAFLSAPTTHKPGIYAQGTATADAAIACRLPCIMAVSRFMHYLKCVSRSRIGAFMERDDMEKWLNRWISHYAGDAPAADPQARARFPLREARVSVVETPGMPGLYSAVVQLRPWLPREELATSLRLVTSIPPQVG